MAALGDTFTTTGTAVTFSATELPVMLPLPGCRTLTCRVPAAVALPVAFNAVGETYVVATGAPLISTWESLAKLAPFRLI